jgi:hypothetical protein
MIIFKQGLEYGFFCAQNNSWKVSNLQAATSSLHSFTISILAIVRWGGWPLLQEGNSEKKF